MNKAKIIMESSETSVLNERIFLAKMHSPFIVSLLCSFQNQLNLFLVMELLTGGDLRYHFLNYAFFFTERQLKFLLANMILGIEYIHSKGVVHRDIKPENIIFNSKGYLKITDFGISCYKEKLDKKDDSGTPAYMAPETIKGKKQDYSVDFYSLGVVGYEVMKGIVPYDSNDREEIKKMMKNDEIHLTKKDKLKTTYSEFCLDFINRLLEKDPEERLGYNGGEKELKEHSFFTGIDWDSIQKLKYKSPIYEIIKFSKLKHGYIQELFDFEYCNRNEDFTPELAKLYINITKNTEYNTYFQHYTCVCVENIIRELNQDKKGRNKGKKLTRSQSMNNIDPEYKYSNNKRTDYQYRNGNNLNLPYINNNQTEIYGPNRGTNMGNYFPNNLLNYENNLAKLNFDYNLKKAQLKNMNFPFLYPQNNLLPFNYNGLGLFPNMNQSLESSFLPMINQKNSNFMNKIMSKFYKQMNQDRNNFFIKSHRNKNMFNNNYEDEYDYDNDYYPNDFLGNEQFKFRQYNSPQFYSNPYYPNMNNNFFYEQRGKQSNRKRNSIRNGERDRDRYRTKRRSRIINNEENSIDSEEKYEK
jgi:serine/threonine protein kinase